MSSSNAPPPPPELLCKECSQPLPKKQRTSSFSRRTPDALPGAKSSGKDATDASSDASDASGPSKFTDEERINLMKGACETILQCIGEDNEREGLLKTPERWAKALLFLTQGYSQTVEEVTNNAVFEEGLGGSQDMVVVRDIDIHSLCEHHMVPFTGKVHVGYIPRQKVLGISKMARIAEMFSRRLQVQERLTRQIAEAIMESIDPLGVAVVVECSHMCMVMRGVQKVGSNTVTSSVLGCFQSDSKTRGEFFSIINGRR